MPMQIRDAREEEIFEGFLPPTENWSKLPHALIDNLHLIETVGEMKIVLYVLRHTWGFQDKDKRISLDEFANGRKRKNGKRLDNGTGLSVATVRNGIKRAIAHGFIIRETDGKDKARMKNYYSLNMVNLSDKDYHPDCQSLSPEVIEVSTRTWKDTPETTISPNQEKNPIGIVTPIKNEAKEKWQEFRANLNQWRPASDTADVYPIDWNEEKRVLTVNASEFREAWLKERIPKVVQQACSELDIRLEFKPD